MRRRLLSAACALTLSSGLALGVALVANGPAQAAVVTSTVGGITYRADNAAPAAGATVTAVDGTAPKALVLPDQVTISGTTYAVTAVGESAADSLNLTSVTLPVDLSVIDDNAFAGNKLTAVTLPQAVTLIDTAAFAFNQLAKITIPASVTAIGPGAFTVNPLTTVVFAGGPPTTFTASGGSNVGSLGDDADNGPGSGDAPTIYFATAFTAPGLPGGFTTPTYKGYRSAVADPTLTIAPATLLAGRQGQAYGQALTTTGGTAPYVYTVRRSTLPPGLTLTAAGLLAGTPTAAGTYTFTVRVTDATGTPTGYGTRTYTLTVAAAPTPTPSPTPTTSPTASPTPTPSPTATATPTTATLAITMSMLSTNNGGLAKIKITVTNTGGTTAQSVLARITKRPAGVKLIKKQAKIGTLAPGASKTVTLKARSTRKATLTVLVSSSNAASTSQKFTLAAR